jgi:high-affinity K+ transport system ATPase subunit B
MMVSRSTKGSSLIAAMENGQMLGVLSLSDIVKRVLPAGKPAMALA